MSFARRRSSSSISIALFALIREILPRTLARPTRTGVVDQYSNSFDENDDRSTSSSMTSTMSTNRTGGGQSSTIPNLLVERQMRQSISNIRSSNASNQPTLKKSGHSNNNNNNKILYPEEIFIEHKNTRYVPPVPEASLHQAEHGVKTKHTELLVNFFETRQPTYIFEPLRKEYYWTDEPFDEDKISRLEKLLHNTSYFVQSIFWYLRILLAVCTTVPIEIVHTILAGLIMPILIRVPVIVADTLIKPFYSGLFNALILPIGILLWNTSDLLAKTLEPLVRLFNLFFEPCIDCFRSVSLKSIDGQIGDGDGRQRLQNMDLKKSTTCV